MDYTNSALDGAALINNPNMGMDLKPKVRSVKDADQARRVLNAMLTFARERLIINSRIVAKINAEKPFTQHSLEAEGLGWKSNFTTKFLPQTAEKVAARGLEAIQGLKYLTNSELPPHIPGASYKTEIFRKKLTDVVRKHKDWVPLLEDLSQENAIFGYTAVGWLDEFTWLPKHFRQDEFFVPQGTKQRAENAQIILFKEIYLPHELLAVIEDKDSAESAGWNIENTVEAINNAAPPSFRSRTNEYYRQYQDMRRELSATFSFEAGSRIIECWSMLAREVDGKVSHYRLAGGERKEVFTKEDRFDSMRDVAAFYSYQKGNGTMHGSKGIGREIYELAGIIDRNRNEVVDRLMLSGKAIIQTDDKNVKRFRMSVVGNAILIGRGYTVLEQKIDGDVQPFLQLDAYLGLIVDQLIGSVSPRQLTGERVTKAQVDLFAQREEEVKDTKMLRFLSQFVEMMGTIQKRILDPETVDKDAKQLQKELLEVMTREEVEILRDSPVAGTVSDLTPTQKQQMVLIAQENQGNPLYNQRALQEEKIMAQVGPDYADKLLLPDEDPTVVAEQTRMQQLEIGLLAAGQAVPVSPRDNHKVHLGLIMPLMEQLATAINAGQANTATLEIHVAHALDHYNQAVNQGTPPAEMADINSLLAKLQKAVAELKKLDEQAQAMQQAGQQLQQQSAAEDEMAGQSLAVASVGDTLQ